MRIEKLIFTALTATILPTALTAQTVFNEMTYSKRQTLFQLNAPTAAKVRIYKSGQGGKATKTVKMKANGKNQ